MNVLFLSPPLKEKMFPSLGIAYLASILNENGHDAMLNDGNNSSFSDLLSYVNKIKPDIVGITMNTTNRFEALKLSKEIKDKFKLPIMLGGPHPTLLSDQILKNYPFVDYIIRNEGEYSTLELINSLSKSGDLKKIKGLSYRQGSNIMHNERAEIIPDLDKLPFPEYKFFDLMSYAKQVEYPRELDKYPHGSIISSRGCPYQCTFCSSSSFWGHKIRFRSAKNVVDEIEHLYNNYNIRFIMYNDDNFTSDRERAIQICKMIIDKGLHKNMMWQCRAEVNLMNKELVSWMKKAGCNMIEFGVEDATPEGIKAFKKSHTQQQVRDAFKLMKEFDIKTKSYFIVGGPHETKKNIELKKQFIQELDPTVTTASILLAYPGTEIYEDGKKNGLWDDSVWLNKCVGKKFHNHTPIYTGPNLNYSELMEASAEINHWWGRKTGQQYSIRDNIKVAFDMVKEREFYKIYSMSKGVLKNMFKK